MRLSLAAALCLLTCCSRRPARTDAPQQFEVAVTRKGFEPARIEVAPGQKVVLRITRKVSETCADAVDVQGDPVRHMLPVGSTVEVRATAPASGELAFACPMQMVRGAIAVVGQ